jgi:pilus assembly protein CpaF
VRWFDSEDSSAERGESRAGRTDDPFGSTSGEVVPGVRLAAGGLLPSVAEPILALLGPLARFAQPGVSDMLLGPGGRLWLDRGGGAEPVESWPPLLEAEVSELAQTLIEAGGRHLDNASPCVDVALGDGVRVHAALAPVSARGTAVSIRLPASRQWTLDALLELQLLDAGQAERLRREVGGRSNILITGAAGSGKTTLLSALMHHVPPGERIVTIEDVAELQIAHPHVVSLEARQANSEGEGAVQLPRLVREALRMRPDRIVLGECRGEEIRELLMALGTGHDGGAGTLHARSLAEVPARLEALGSLAGLGTDALARLSASSIDLVVHLERVEGRRRIAGFGTLTEQHGRLVVVSSD